MEQRCFVIMPFSSPDAYGEDGHFTEVYEDLFMPAIVAAGLSPVRADTTSISRHILADLLAEIEQAAVVLCDLSTANPNVLFELGWAFRADRPCVLVKDDRTAYPFDLQHAHMLQYHSSLKARLVKGDVAALAELITNTANDDARRWSLVQSLGLDARLRRSVAAQGDPVAAAVLEMRAELAALRADWRETLAGGKPSTLPPTVQGASSARERAERERILMTLEEERGDVGRAAQRLGMSRQVLYKRIKVLGLELGRIRG